MLWVVKARLRNAGFGVSKAVCLGADVRGFRRGPWEGEGRGVAGGGAEHSPSPQICPCRPRWDPRPDTRQPVVPQLNLGIWQIPV